MAERIFWGCIIAICVLMSIITTEWMFNDYLEHQTATLITIEQRQRNQGFKHNKLNKIVFAVF